MDVMKKKGQGTFEYILLLAGVLLIVVLAIVLLRGGLFQSQSTAVQKNNCMSALALSGNCYNPDRTWNPAGSVLRANADACTLVQPQITQSGTCNATTPVGTANTTGYCCGAGAS